jgi:hypothetical protein
MIAGADSIDDMGLLRHGAMGRLFTGLRAPSPLGTFLRTFTRAPAVRVRLKAIAAQTTQALFAANEPEGK